MNEEIGLSIIISIASGLLGGGGVAGIAFRAMRDRLREDFVDKESFNRLAQEHTKSIEQVTEHLATSVLRPLEKITERLEAMNVTQAVQTTMIESHDEAIRTLFAKLENTRRDG